MSAFIDAMCSWERGLALSQKQLRDVLTHYMSTTEGRDRVAISFHEVVRVNLRVLGFNPQEDAERRSLTAKILCAVNLASRIDLFYKEVPEEELGRDSHRKLRCLLGDLKGTLAAKGKSNVG